MFKLLKNGNFSTNFLLSYKLTIHLLYGNLFSIENVFTFVNFSKRTLSDTVFLSENVVSHLNLDLVVHQIFLLV